MAELVYESANVAATKVTWRKMHVIQEASLLHLKRRRVTKMLPVYDPRNVGLCFGYSLVWLKQLFEHPEKIDDPPGELHAGLIQSLYEREDGTIEKMLKMLSMKIADSWRNMTKAHAAFTMSRELPLGVFGTYMLWKPPTHAGAAANPRRSVYKYIFDANIGMYKTLLERDLRGLFKHILASY